MMIQYTVHYKYSVFVEKHFGFEITAVVWLLRAQTIYFLHKKVEEKLFCVL